MHSSNQLSDQKFKSDEEFKKISGSLVKMKRELVKKNNADLKCIIKNKIVKLMQAKDRYFNELFEDVMYGGSFYKNLKVSKPDEYDLNLVIKLPINYELLKIEPDNHRAGYVRIKMLERDFSRNEDFFAKIRCGNYLDQNKFRSWIQSVLDKVLSDFPQNSGLDGYIMRCHRSTYDIKYRQSGPAFTITVTRSTDCREMSFDLVPCLLFRDGRQISGFEPHDDKWIAIAKPLPLDAVDDVRLLWRAGFYDDEKKLLAGHNKPVIRIMKKLRDIKGWYQLKSYFIETLFLDELENSYFANNCERASRTNVLMYMLRVLHQKLADRLLLNYWNDELNMFDGILRLSEIASELQTIINRIDNNIKQNKNILSEIFDLRY